MVYMSLLLNATDKKEGEWDDSHENCCISFASELEFWSENDDRSYFSMFQAQLSRIS